VAISTAVWAAIGLWIGVTFGQSIGNLLARYPWIYLVALGLVIVVVAVAVVRFWRAGDHPKLSGELRSIDPISKSAAGVPFEHAAPQATINPTSTDREAADQRPGSR
jgi:hypothetical protein